MRIINLQKLRKWLELIIRQPKKCVATGSQREHMELCYVVCIWAQHQDTMQCIHTTYAFYVTLNTQNKTAFYYVIARILNTFMNEAYRLHSWITLCIVYCTSLMVVIFQFLIIVKQLTQLTKPVIINVHARF